MIREYNETEGAERGKDVFGYRFFVHTDVKEQRRDT
jgi:hypothetical protein